MACRRLSEKVKALLRSVQHGKWPHTKPSIIRRCYLRSQVRHGLASMNLPWQNAAHSALCSLGSLGTLLTRLTRHSNNMFFWLPLCSLGTCFVPEAGSFRHFSLRVAWFLTCLALLSFFIVLWPGLFCFACWLSLPCTECRTISWVCFFPLGLAIFFTFCLPPHAVLAAALQKKKMQHVIWDTPPCNKQVKIGETQENKDSRWHFRSILRYSKILSLLPNWLRFVYPLAPWLTPDERDLTILTILTWVVRVESKVDAWRSGRSSVNDMNDMKVIV